LPDLSIKNVPTAVVEKLRDRAASQHRSMQGELLALILDALALPPANKLHGAAADQTGTRRIEEIAAANRARQKKPHDAGPMAVDIVRAERDAR
jgi:antitoxin FitA